MDKGKLQHRILSRAAVTDPEDRRHTPRRRYRARRLPTYTAPPSPTPKSADTHRAAVTEPEDFRYAGTVYALKFFLPTFSFKKKYGQAAGITLMLEAG